MNKYFEKLKFKNNKDIKDWMKKTLSLLQFNDCNKKIITRKKIYHIYNNFYPFYNNNIHLVREILSHFFTDVRSLEVDLGKVHKNYKKEKRENKPVYIHPDCFYYILDYLNIESECYGKVYNKYIYCVRKNNTKEYIYFNEIKYYLYRLTENIFYSPSKMSILSTNYLFLLKDNYYKKTGRRLNRNKICWLNIMLEKIGMIYRTQSTNNNDNYCYQIGKNNVYYQYKEIPDIIYDGLNRKRTLIERERDESKKKNKLISSQSTIIKNLRKENNKLKNTENILNDYNNTFI